MRSSRQGGNPRGSPLLRPRRARRVIRTTVRAYCTTFGRAVRDTPARHPGAYATLDELNVPPWWFSLCRSTRKMRGATIVAMALLLSGAIAADAFSLRGLREYISRPSATSRSLLQAKPTGWPAVELSSSAVFVSMYELTPTSYAGKSNYLMCYDMVDKAKATNSKAIQLVPTSERPPAARCPRRWRHSAAWRRPPPPPPLNP
jgi:hypothetical protein